jgi:predicted DCC family thiol-disulfide oxidoreductase YuxK
MAYWVRRHDRAGRVRVVANQKPGVLVRYGITREEADRSAWLIVAGEGRLEGAAALNRVLAEVATGWKVAAGAYRFGPLARLEEAFYRWFAGRRSWFRRFGVTPECAEAGSDCV